MHSHFRLPSASSNETNASGSTEQTHVSFDDITVESSKASLPYREQGSGKYAPEISYPPAIGSNFTPHGSSRLDLHGACCGVLTESNGENCQQPRNNISYGHKTSTSSESVPLLSRSELEQTLQNIICSDQFKKYFETEYADLIKARKNYKSLKKVFLALAVLNIILIICAVSVMPVIFVSLRLEGSHIMQSALPLDMAMEDFLLQKLVSPGAREIIRKHVFCGKCGLPKELSESEEVYNKECCEQNEDLSTSYRKLKTDVYERLATFNSDVMGIQSSISPLEAAVIGLEAEVYRDKPGQPPRNKKTLIHQKVVTNNQLLNKLLKKERSLLQLTGTAGSKWILWEEDICNGELVTSRNNSIFVSGGGTYFLYAKIQFSKRICSGTEMLEYHVMKKKEYSSDPPVTVAHVKQSCPGGSILEQALTVQKVIHLDRKEKATFLIQYNTVFHSYVSYDLKTHSFGIFEI